MDTRRELKLKYRQTPKLMGVYQIKNTVNGKILIGSSMNLNASRNRYHYQLDFKRHHYHEIQEDLERYGIKAFTFEILETIDPEEYSQDERPYAVEMLEEKWLDNLQPYGEKGYHRRKEGGE